MSASHPLLSTFMQLRQYLRGAGKYLTAQTPSQSMLLIVMLVGQSCIWRVHSSAYHHLLMKMCRYDGLSLPPAQYCFVASALSPLIYTSLEKASWSGKFAQLTAATLVVTFLATDCFGAFIASNGYSTSTFPLLTNILKTKTCMSKISVNNHWP